MSNQVCNATSHATRGRGLERERRLAQLGPVHTDEHRSGLGCGPVVGTGTHHHDRAVRVGGERDGHGAEQQGTEPAQTSGTQHHEPGGAGLADEHLRGDTLAQLGADRESGLRVPCRLRCLGQPVPALFEEPVPVLRRRRDLPE